MTSEDAMDEVYYEEFIKKRGLKDRWIQFWARLIGEKMYLYVSKDCKEVDFCETILLSPCSRCILLKRRNYSFRFRLTTSEESYYFKCESNLQRHRWIHMIHLASNGKSPESPPNNINMRCCYYEGRANEIIKGVNRKQSSCVENNCEEREIGRVMSEEKESSSKEDNHCGSSSEETEEMDCGRSKQIVNKGSGSTSSRESFHPTVNEMTDTSEGASKESEIKTKEGKSSYEMGNVTKALDSATATSSGNLDSPVQVDHKEPFSFKTFALSSFRKSLKRQSYPPKQGKEPIPSKDQRNSIINDKISAIKYSMDNPAFTDDDESIEKGSCYQPARIIKVASRDE